MDFHDDDDYALFEDEKSTKTLSDDDGADGCMESPPPTRPSRRNASVRKDYAALDNGLVRIKSTKSKTQKNASNKGVDAERDKRRQSDGTRALENFSNKTSRIEHGGRTGNHGLSHPANVDFQEAPQKAKKALPLPQRVLVHTSSTKLASLKQPARPSGAAIAQRVVSPWSGLDAPRDETDLLILPTRLLKPIFTAENNSDPSPLPATSFRQTVYAPATSASVNSRPIRKDSDSEHAAVSSKAVATGPGAKQNLIIAPPGFKQLESSSKSFSKPKEVIALENELAQYKAQLQEARQSVHTQEVVLKPFVPKLFKNDLRRAIIMNNLFEDDSKQQKALFEQVVLDWYGVPEDTTDDAVFGVIHAATAELNYTRVQSNLRSALTKSFRDEIGIVLKNLGWWEDIPAPLIDGHPEIRADRLQRFKQEWNDLKNNLMTRKLNIYESAAEKDGKIQLAGTFKSPLLVRLMERTLKKEYMNIWKIDRPHKLTGRIVCAFSTILTRVIAKYVPSEESKYQHEASLTTIEKDTAGASERLARRGDWEHNTQDYLFTAITGINIGGLDEEEEKVEDDEYEIMDEME